MTDTKKSSYSTTIAIACCLIVFGGAGIVFSTASVFYTVVADAFGVGKGTFSIYMTIVCLVMSFSLPILGKMATKMDIRKIAVIAGLCIAISFVLFATAQSLIFIYIGAVFQGFGVAGPLYMIVPTMVSRWFVKRNGFVMGLAMAFTGIAGIILQPGMAAIIEATSWRTAYWVEAAMAAVFVIIPGYFMLRSYPADKGQIPFGFEETAAGVSSAAKNPISAAVSLKTAMKSSTFYTMAILAGCINLYTTIAFYWTSYAASLGYDLVIAATISSVAMWGQLCGKLGLGFISDRNFNLGTVLAYGFGAAGLILAIFGGAAMGTTMLFVSIFLYGLTHGSCAVETPIIAQHCFGNGKDYAQIYSNIMSVGSFCAAIGSSLFGYIVDWTGSYRVVLIVGLALSVICFLMARISISSSKKLVRE